jgi:3-deoxy-D-manno-octulosonic-acid transferase
VKKEGLETSAPTAADHSGAPQTQDRRDIVVVGASAGRVNALTQLVTLLHEELPAAVRGSTRAGRRSVSASEQNRSEAPTVPRPILVEDEPVDA